MVENVLYGLRRAITEAITGFALSCFVNALVSSGLMPLQYRLLIYVINMVAIILLIKAMPYWSTGYLLGWSIGMGMMLRVGTVEAWDFLAIAFSVLMLIVRLLK